MDFKAFSHQFAIDYDANYTEYDENTSIFTLRLEGARYQMVLARVLVHEKYSKPVVHISSKVCSIQQNIDYKALLTHISEYVYTRFIIDGEDLKTEASFFLDNVTEKMIERMILEVAETADEWEKKITGKDIN
jgi:hypothetical protein